MIVEFLGEVDQGVLRAAVGVVDEVGVGAMVSGAERHPPLLLTPDSSCQFGVRSESGAGDSDQGPRVAARRGRGGRGSVINHLRRSLRGAQIASQRLARRGGRWDRGEMSSIGDAEGRSRGAAGRQSG